jgi:hypothetical protein
MSTISRQKGAGNCMDRHLLKEIHQYAKEGRSFVNIDSECADSEDYAEFIGPHLYNIEGVNDVKLVKGNLILDHDVSFFGEGKESTNLIEHYWLLVNDTLIVDVGADEHDFGFEEYPKVWLIEKVIDTKHVPIETKQAE